MNSSAKCRSSDGVWNGQRTCEIAPRQTLLECRMTSCSLVTCCSRCNWRKNVSYTSQDQSQSKPFYKGIPQMPQGLMLEKCGLGQFSSDQQPWGFPVPRGKTQKEGNKYEESKTQTGNEGREGSQRERKPLESRKQWFLALPWWGLVNA